MKCLSVYALCLLTSLTVFTGCGGSDASPKSSDGVTAVNTNELVAIGDYLPPLDDGRVEVAPPQNWCVAPRSNKYLARFTPDANTDYPTIILTVAENDGISKATPENLKQFAAEVKAAESVKSVKPVNIGGKFHGVLYRKVSRKKDSVSTTFDRLLVATVVGGRRYTVELRAPSEGSQRDNQNQLYAVAYGLRFAGADDAPTASPSPTEAKPEAAPAAEASTATEAKPAPESEPEAKPEAKPESAAETKPESAPAPKKEPAKPKKPAKSDSDLDDLDELLN